MKKDFAVIRQMANKKLLNADQKKVLVKLFEQKINSLEGVRRQELDKVYSQAEKEYLAKTEKSTLIASTIAKLLKAEKEQKEAEKVLSQNHLTYSVGYGDEKRTLGFNYGSRPAELEKLKNQHNRTLDKVRELKLKLLADINCLPMTYAEINDYIEGELSKI